MTENNNTSPEVEIFDATDIENNKTMAGLAYIIFFLPLITCPNSAYAKFHANQSLLLLIITIAGNIVFSMLPFIGWILRPLFSMVVFVFYVMGLINGFQGKAKRLPIFGTYTILK